MTRSFSLDRRLVTITGSRGKSCCVAIKTFTVSAATAVQ